jgi:hypothetical protein
MVSLPWRSTSWLLKLEVRFCSESIANPSLLSSRRRLQPHRFEDTLLITGGAYGRWGGLAEDRIKHPVKTERVPHSLRRTAETALPDDPVLEDSVAA